MIRLWLSRTTATPIHDQLASQFILGILSARLQPGEKLPSIRTLARRLQLHPNTISGVYRSLAGGGWVIQRPGSGVFVRQPRAIHTRDGIDAFAKSCLEQGLARGYPPQALLRSFQYWLNRPADKFLVVDPDRELAEILAAEISEAVGRAVPFATYDAVKAHLDEDTCLLITGHFARTDPEELRKRACRTIQLKSMQDVLGDHQRPPNPILLGVVSRSKAVLLWASTLLSSLGFSPDAVVLRNLQQQGWCEGLGACHAVAADIVSAQQLSWCESNLVVFRIVSSEFLNRA